jgi:hypothetical protein
MSLSITELFDQGPALTLDRRGSTCVRAFLVEGLDANLDPCGRLLQAATASAGGVTIPQYGYGLDSIRGIFVSQVRPDFYPAGAKTSALVRCTYTTPEHQGGSPGNFIFSGEAATSESPVARDINGDPLRGTYTDPDTGETVSWTPRFSVLRPRPIITFQTISRILNPLDQVLGYSGKVNGSSWQGGDPHTWICRGIGFDRLGPQPLDNTVQWKMTYVFQYDPLTWDQDSYFQDPVTKRFPNDAERSDDNSKGIFTYEYDEADFDALSIPRVQF